MGDFLGGDFLVGDFLGEPSNCSGSHFWNRTLAARPPPPSRRRTLRGFEADLGTSILLGDLVGDDSRVETIFLFDKPLRFESRSGLGSSPSLSDRQSARCDIVKGRRRC
uniref:Uncharacterized protein n=1 Tax=Bionectria ochroleuca TaxID=29856 RepID=A0A8H7KCR3_BIOOC